MKTPTARKVQLIGATLMVVAVVFYVATLQTRLLWAVPTALCAIAAVLVLVGFGLQRRDERRARASARRR